MNQLETNELEDKLKCIFADVGDQMGAVLRCMIEQEVDMHMKRLIQLNGILNGTICDTTQLPPPPQQ